MCGGSNSVVEDIVSGASQITTGGLVDVNADGSVKGGVTTNLVEDVVKDVTGASAAEEANELAREQFEEGKQKAIDQRAEARSKNARDQLAASRGAASNRRSGKSGDNKGRKGAGDSSVSSLGSDTQDFLGL